MAVRPIFIVKIPLPDHPGSLSRVREQLSHKLSDYHVLVYIAPVEEVSFQAFYEKPITDIEFEELKVLVLKTIDNG